MMGASKNFEIGLLDLIHSLRPTPLPHLWAFSMAPATDKRKQKRPHSSLSEPKPKKARFDTAEKRSADKGKKRSQPVTLPLKNETDTSSDEAEEHEELEVGDAEDEMDVEGPSQTPKDPNGTPAICMGRCAY